MRTLTETKTPVSAQIERAHRTQLERMAVADDRTVSQLVRRAVAEFLERQEEEKR